MVFSRSSGENSRGQGGLMEQSLISPQKGFIWTSLQSGFQSLRHYFVSTCVFTALTTFFCTRRILYLSDRLLIWLVICPVVKKQLQLSVLFWLLSRQIILALHINYFHKVSWLELCFPCFVNLFFFIFKKVFFKVFPPPPSFLCSCSCDYLLWFALTLMFCVPPVYQWFQAFACDCPFNTVIFRPSQRTVTG